MPAQFSFLLGEWEGVVCIVHSDHYQTIALFQGYCTGAVLVRDLNKNDIVVSKTGFRITCFDCAIFSL